MTKRENILTALRRQKPSHVPFALSLCDSLFKEFQKRTGHNSPADYFDFDFRYVGLNSSQYPVDYTAYFPDLPEGAYIDEYGVGHRPGSMAHFSKMIHPMRDFTDPAQVREFPMPDITADYRFEGFSRRVSDLQSAGYAAVYGSFSLFENAWYLRGLDNFLCDMLTDEAMAEAAFERFTAPFTIVAGKVAEAGVDLIICGDDAGTQRAMMMSEELWRQWIKPYTKRVIDAAKRAKPDILVYYHSDGNIEPIIPDLIEIGVDILNPVQPECMDPAKMKKQYGDRLAFWGTIGTQTTMPFGTPEEVRRTVLNMIETGGYDGGLVLAPTHMLEPEVPWENIMAFLDTVKEFTY